MRRLATLQQYQSFDFAQGMLCNSATLQLFPFITFANYQKPAAHSPKLTAQTKQETYHA